MSVPLDGGVTDADPSECESVVLCKELVIEDVSGNDFDECVVLREESVVSVKSDCELCAVDTDVFDTGRRDNSLIFSIFLHTIKSTMK